MIWDGSEYDIRDSIVDKYYFAGSNWDTQFAKRFILSVKRFNKIIESSYYLHLKDQDKPMNVAFEPSTSFGCSMGCLFCASGTLFPIRALNAFEIAQQVIILAKIFNKDFPNNNIRKDVFYSGIGEPTLMIDTLINASTEILNYDQNVKFKISTMGALPDALLTWSKSGLPLRSVQIGIPHWQENKIKEIYSKCKTYSLDLLLNTLKECMTISPSCVIKINYIGIKGFNDNYQDLEKTIEKICSYIGNNYELKLSCLNPTDFAAKNNLFTINKENLDELKKRAQKYQLNDIYTFGPMSKEKLGCGQLAGNYES